MSSYDEIRTGVAVILFDNTKEKAHILMGKRKNKDGNNDGHWCIPGGHMEKYESFDQACRREVREETGLIIDCVKKFDFVNNPMKDIDRHYITLYFTAKIVGGELSLKEPEKFECWDWVPIPLIGESLDGIPQPIFSNMESILKQTVRLQQVFFRQKTEERIGKAISIL